MTVLRVWLVAACAALTLALVPAATAAPADAGKVNFVKAAQSDFDQYLHQHPTQATKEWMNRELLRGCAPTPPSSTRAPTGTPTPGPTRTPTRSTPARRATRPSTSSRTRQGRRLYIPYACGGGACSQYAADIGSPGWRRALHRPRQGPHRPRLQGHLRRRREPRLQGQRRQRQPRRADRPAHRPDDDPHRLAALLRRVHGAAARRAARRAPRSCTTRSTSTSGSPARTCAARSTPPPTSRSSAA